MENSDGKFKKGEHRSPSTEFKKGEHWRPRRDYWDRDWLFNEYVTKQRSASEIAEEWGVRNTAILFWIKKHGIDTRSVSEVRAVKHWGLSGKDNPMYGRTGSANHNWRGGCTPERQSFYMSEEWAAAVSEVWKRDKAACRRCGTTRRPIHVHHIIPFYVKETRADPNNLVLLCINCHIFVHSKKNILSEFVKKEVAG